MRLGGLGHLQSPRLKTASAFDRGPLSSARPEHRCRFPKVHALRRHLTSEAHSILPRRTPWSRKMHVKDEACLQGVELHYDNDLAKCTRVTLSLVQRAKIIAVVT